MQKSLCINAAVSCSLNAPRLPATGFGLGLMGKLGHAWVGAWVVHGMVHGEWCGGGGLVGW